MLNVFDSSMNSSSLIAQSMISLNETIKDKVKVRSKGNEKAIDPMSIKMRHAMTAPVSDKLISQLITLIDLGILNSFGLARRRIT